MQKLLVLEKNTSYYITVHNLFALKIVTRSNNCLQKTICISYT